MCNAMIVINSWFEHVKDLNLNGLCFFIKDY